MNAAAVSFKLNIRFDIGELERVSRWIFETGQNLNLPESILFDFDLCAHEALANVIAYAKENFRCQPIQLELVADTASVSLTIRDKTQAFNPLDAPQPKPVSNLVHVQIGGLGVHLIRSLMDVCSYERINESNSLTMRAYLPVDAAVAAQRL